MSLHLEDRSRIGTRRVTTASLVALSVVLFSCGGATRGAASPHGQTRTTAGLIAPHVERLVIADRGTIAMVARQGCLATVKTSAAETGGHDELRVRCPKPERIKAWFDAADRVTATLALEPVSDDESTEAPLPTAKLLTATGKTLRVANVADVEKLAAEVRALSAELASAEQVAPGPASADGWQMLHVMGPAHVLFAGTPARGVFEARVSTNGQYLCEFITSVGDGPIRATKSGWLAPATAAQAIDAVLRPFNPLSPNEAPRATFAAGMKGGTEQRSNLVSTAAVFERFAEMQDALGDACLPELEAPSSAVGL